MLDIPGYTRLETIHVGRKHRVVCAVESDTGRLAALKTPSMLLPSGKALTTLEKEFDYLRRLDLPDIPTALRLIPTGRSIAVVMECFEFPSLHLVAKDRALSLAETLGLFEKLAAILAQVHARGIIHRDINPSNILYERATGRVVLVDFGSAIDMPQQSSVGLEPETVEGTLAYMSPEQTGRLNRPVDFRSDFYSFGVSLYETLTGRRPFAGGDTGALIHSHLALQPPAPSAVHPEIPAALSELVMKCLAKDAGDRYQSAQGLHADLARCRAELKQSGTIAPFALGTADAHDRFQFPERIVGRVEELQALQELYDQAAATRSAIVMVRGVSGVGKTSLVQELNRAVAARQGYVAYGKYDQYSRAVPFSGLIQALSMLIRQILGEGEERIAAWQEKILAALDQNGRVLCEVIPDLETLIGEQPPVPALDPVEARTLLGTLFRQFMEALGHRDHPLLLFLDDLQWIDAASLSLLELMANLGSESAILCIGAYRSNEVPASHPLAATLGEMRKREAPIAEVVVGPLGEGDLRGYLAAMFHLPAQDVEPLAAALHAKTGGNPLFFRTLLTSLFQDGHLRFDPGAGRWVWNERAVAGMDYAENVVDVLQSRLATLPAECLELLTLGACIGNPFPLDTLASLSGRPRARIVRGLGPALAQGLLTSPRRDMELYAQDSADRLDEIDFAFCHDRIQQAAYAMLEQARKPALHLAVGRMHLDHLSQLAPDQDDSRLFDVLEHLRKGAALLEDPEERLQVAALALRAGRKAKTSTAFADAAELLEFARSLLPEAPWRSEYALWLEISLELAQSLYLAGRYDAAEARCAEVLDHATADRDRLRLFNIQAKQYHHQARYAEAVELEYRALTLMGFDFPRDDAALFPMFMAEKARIDELLCQLVQGDPAGLYDRPETANPDHVLAQEMLFDLFADNYLVGNGLVCAVVAAVMARLAMEEGNSPMASVAYIQYACTLCAMGFDAEYYRTGHAIGSLAVRLAERYAVPALQNYAYHVFSLAVNHWANPLASNHAYWSEASRLALASGSPYSGYVYLQLAHVLLAAGAPLAEVQAQAARSLEFLSSSGMAGIVTLLELIVLQPLKHLLGQTRSIATLDDDGFDAEGVAEQFKDLPFFLGSLRYAQLRVACLSHEPPDPETLQQWIEVVAATQQGQSLLADSWFFCTLAFLEHARREGGSDDELAQRIQAGREKLELWAELCPANFRHKLLLVEAEALDVAGDAELQTILDTYDAAIDAALEANALQDAALAAEKAGRFWVRREKPHLAKAYFEQALAFYARWGATGMEWRLRQAYDALLSDVTVRGGAPRRGAGEFAMDTSSSGMQWFSEGLDMLSVIKATQAVSRHMDLDDLGRELTAIATENAGATKGVLILNKDGRFVVSNVVQAGAQKQALSSSAPGDVAVEAFEGISHAVVNYVMRTGVRVILNDISGLTASAKAALSPPDQTEEQAALFAKCPYLVATRPASLCCLPIVLQNEIRGLLYLENDATRGAFRNDGVQVLNILAAQAAISMENARVYHELNRMNLNLESLVQARTAELHEKNEELNQKNLDLFRLSTTDQLTGVFNRRSIEDRLNREIKRCGDSERCLAVILIDVDRFKHVNDTHGHNIGDEVLVAVTQTISRNVRATDLFGRWGGEEFLVVISEFVQNALPFAERLRRALEETRHPLVGAVTVSMGLAIYEPGETPSHFVSRADKALYRAKQNGRNRVEVAE